MSAKRIIEQRPPEPTGDAEADIRAQAEWSEYLRDELNGILREIYRRIREDET